MLFKAGLTAVLCSPGFLYLNEPVKADESDIKEKQDSVLNEFAIASRLSYFLWSTSPDKTLLKLAHDGKLSEPAVFNKQIERMLQDEKAAAFTADFPERWLHLYKLGNMPPETYKFNQYYVGELELAMRRETELFFDHVLQNNLSLDHFLDCDFTFVNRPLAQLYWMNMEEFDAAVKKQLGKTVCGPDEFVRMRQWDKRRGGLLGQASVLTVTANGIDTSPVIRGVWVLENILGTPPAAPPEGIEPLEPDTRGAKSIREQLQKHRESTACMACHQKIDPPGFAMESFDAIGGARTEYIYGRKRTTIDPSGVMADGQKFSDLAEMKQILLSQKDQFTRCLTEKMLAYALGRQLNAFDRPHVDQIVSEMGRKDAGLQDLVKLVANSKPFHSE